MVLYFLIFEFLSITFMNIETKEGIHTMFTCTALSASFRLFHHMSNIKSYFHLESVSVSAVNVFFVRVREPDND